MKKIAILLPIHNGLAYTMKTLENLSQLLFTGNRTDSVFAYELVITDDGSSDGTSEWIKMHAPWVHLLPGDGNLWWSGGINKAAAFALSEREADYLLLWNNDIQAGENYFPALERILKENSPHIIVGSKVYVSGTDNIIWSMGGCFNRISGIKYPIGYGERDGEKFRRPLDVDWLPGMGTCLHRAVIEKIGYWDEKRFPQYHGDSDFTRRAAENGYILRVYPELTLWNNIDHTGTLHYGRWRDLLRSFTSIRSNYHIGKDLLFYRLHGKGLFCYYGLCVKYFRYVGGFMKGKFLNILKTSKVNKPILNE